MSDRIPRFELLPPSAGDELLSHASKCKVEFYRLAGGGLPPELHFELSGDIKLRGSQARELTVSSLL